MVSLDEGTLRESVFAVLRTRMLTQAVFTRDQLADVEVLGQRIRLVGPQTGIWKPRRLTAALSIVTGYYDSPSARPYDDELGPDGLLRYKWRGIDPDHADNRALRAAMIAGLPLVWFLGVGHAPGTKTQVFQPVMPVWLIAEEPEAHQFVVALDADQRALVHHGEVAVNEIERRYNIVVARQRVHQPLFRRRVLHAYQERCAVCRLPFSNLLDAAHIKSDSLGGSAAVSNGLALCKIHRGAFDADILGIRPDYRIVIRDDVLDTVDGPTLQHSLKEMHGATLAMLPPRRAERPDRELLEERFGRFAAGPI